MSRRSTQLNAQQQRRVLRVCYRQYLSGNIPTLDDLSEVIGMLGVGTLHDLRAALRGRPQALTSCQTRGGE